MRRIPVDHEGDPAPSSTAPTGATLGADRASLWWRRSALAVLVLFVIAALTQQFGVRTDTVEGSAGDLSVELRYADRGRGALAAPFSIRVQRSGGFTDQIEVLTRQSYLEIFDDNGFEPDAASMSTEDGNVIWTFDPPPGDTLDIILDARIEPGVFGRERGATTVVADGDEVTLEYTTWVAP